MNKDISSLYGNRVRVRVCGLCWWNDALLMIKHAGITDGDFWAPPGGGIELGQTVEETLVREFEEETGIIVRAGQFKFACEFINEPLHSIELFFEAIYQEGEIIKGIDPEMTDKNQIIESVKWMTFKEMKEIPTTNLHGIFKMCQEPQEILKIGGFWRI
jgi:8-oxo-dGTP diphosphatase